MNLNSAVALSLAVFFSFFTGCDFSKEVSKATGELESGKICCVNMRSADGFYEM